MLLYNRLTGNIIVVNFIATYWPGVWTIANYFFQMHLDANFLSLGKQRENRTYGHGLSPIELSRAETVMENNHKNLCCGWIPCRKNNVFLFSSSQECFWWSEHQTSALLINSGFNEKERMKEWKCLNFSCTLPFWGIKSWWRTCQCSMTQSEFVFISSLHVEGSGIKEDDKMRVELANELCSVWSELKNVSSSFVFSVLKYLIPPRRRWD